MPACPSASDSPVQGEAGPGETRAGWAIEHQLRRAPATSGASGPMTTSPMLLASQNSMTFPASDTSRSSTHVTPLRSTQPAP
eukprot:scaffold149_cov383-Prasinococcus_capsulatus_cf.AAC.26